MSTQSQYPMLESCRIILRPETGTSDNPPVRLSAACLKAASEPLQKPYEFDLEYAILQKRKDRQDQWKLMRSSSKDELQKNVISRMKSVTNASEDVCVSLLEQSGYDLKVSVETYLS